MGNQRTAAQRATQAAEAKKLLEAKKAAEAAKLTASPEPTAEPVQEVEVEVEVKTDEAPKAINGFLNPFIKGVTYDAFIKAVGKSTVENYCKGKLEKHEIAWVSEEVNSHKKNKKNK